MLNEKLFRAFISVGQDNVVVRILHFNLDISLQGNFTYFRVTGYQYFIFLFLDICKIAGNYRCAIFRGCFNLWLKTRNLQEWFAWTPGLIAVGDDIPFRIVDIHTDRLFLSYEESNTYVWVWQ